MASVVVTTGAGSSAPAAVSIVEQMLATRQVSTFPAPGITSDVQATWDYRYVFGTNPQ